MIIYHCTRDSALFLSYLLLCHPYIPFHFIEMIFILVYILFMLLYDILFRFNGIHALGSPLYTRTHTHSTISVSHACTPLHKMHYII